MKMLMIRADDLGYSEGTNYGIAKAVKEGIIKTVGVMTNMPTVEQGLHLLEGVDVCYGLHTNICVGKPIVDSKLIPSITNSDGEFKASKEYRSAKEDFVNLDEVILEIEAQYERFVELVGHKPSYFEGHAVASENFFKGLEIVAKRHDCDYFPISFSGPSKFRNTNVHISINSMSKDYDPFVEMKKLCDEELPQEDCRLLVCHPGYLDEYVLRKSSLTMARPLEVEFSCNPEVLEYINTHDIKLVTYDDLK